MGDLIKLVQIIVDHMKFPHIICDYVMLCMYELGMSSMLIE